MAIKDITSQFGRGFKRTVGDVKEYIEKAPQRMDKRTIMAEKRLKLVGLNAKIEEKKAAQRGYRAQHQTSGFGDFNFMGDNKGFSLNPQEPVSKRTIKRKKARVKHRITHRKRPLRTKVTTYY